MVRLILPQRIVRVERCSVFGPPDGNTTLDAAFLPNPKRLTEENQEGRTTGSLATEEEAGPLSKNVWERGETMSLHVEKKMLLLRMYRRQCLFFSWRVRMCRNALRLSSCLGGETAWQLTEDVQEGQCLFLSRRKGCLATYWGCAGRM